MIKIVDLKKNFSGQEVLQGLNLSIPANKITAIVGRSGCGKSVLLKHIIGLLKPDSGEVRVNGDILSELGSSQLNEIRKNFGMLFQGAALLDSMDPSPGRRREAQRKRRAPCAGLRPRRALPSAAASRSRSRRSKGRRPTVAPPPLAPRAQTPRRRAVPVARSLPKRERAPIPRPACARK